MKRRLLLFLMVPVGLAVYWVLDMNGTSNRGSSRQITASRPAARFPATPAPVCTANGSPPRPDNPITPCRGSGSTPTQTVLFTAPDTTANDPAHDGHYGITIWRPGGLVNSPRYPVPMVFGFQNVEHWAGETGSTAPWACARFGCVYVQLSPNHLVGTHGAQYGAPTVADGRSPTVCGASGTDHCDDVPAVLKALSLVECRRGPYCQNVNPKRVYFTGTSKGGLMAQDVACDPRTSARVDGISVISNELINFRSGSRSPPPTCPTLNGTGSPSGSLNRAQSWLWIYGTADDAFNGPTQGGCDINNRCGTGDGLDLDWTSHGASSPEYHFSDRTLARQIGADLGCSSTPSSSGTAPGSTSGPNGYVWTYVFFGTGCAHPGAATGYYRGAGLGHEPDGRYGLDFAAASWDFWHRFPGY